MRGKSESLHKDQITYEADTEDWRTKFKNIKGKSKTCSFFFIVLGFGHAQENKVRWAYETKKRGKKSTI